MLALEGIRIVDRDDLDWVAVLLHVLLELPLRRVALAAWLGADERQLVPVPVAQVAPQVVVLGELVLAGRALVRRAGLSVLTSLMLDEIRAVAEASTTLTTPVWPLTGVLSLMSLQAEAARERFGAEAASVPAR